jgi:3'-5' exoribonuclease
MKTYYVKDLQKGLVLSNETFAVKSMESAQTKDGKTYYKIALIDKTGEIKGQVWNDKLPNIEKGAFSAGKVVMISGTVEDYRGILQLNIFSAVRVDEAQLDEYMEASDFNLDELWESLQKYISAIKTPELKALIDKIFADPDISRKFRIHPAAEYVHHSFQGGLLEHTVEMLDLAQPLKKYYPEANFDLINAAIVLHDIGKLYELEPVGVVVQRTVEGHLVGHLVKSYQIVHDFGKNIVPAKLLLQLEHIVLAHHGQLDYGSPVVPATIEAMIVHMIDDTSCKVRIFQRLIRKAAGNESEFTEWDKLLGTRVYLGGQDELTPELI